MFFEVALIAYILDMFIGEFPYIKHPVVFMGHYVSWFERHFYKDSIVRGIWLTIGLLLLTCSVIYPLSLIDNVFIQGILASFCISSKMLYDEVKKVALSDSPKQAIAMLVSRDTKDMTSSDIHKASIETYGENLSDGVIAPLFYIVCFGVLGGFLYKAVNTLDSMVGYRNEKYENFGKFSARLDDVLNFIPARITAVLIALLMGSKKALVCFYSSGKHHESMNAGLPIASFAYALDISLGGPTSYFGKLKDKPYFGQGRKTIEQKDVLKALKVKKSLDITLIVVLSVIVLMPFFY